MILKKFASFSKHTKEIYDPLWLDQNVKDNQILQKDAGSNGVRKTSEVLRDNASKAAKERQSRLVDMAEKNSRYENELAALKKDFGTFKKEKDLYEKIIKVDDVTTELKKIFDKKDEKSLGNKMKKEASRAGNVILAKQLTNISSKVLATQIIPLLDKSDEQNISGFFQTDFGKSLMSFILGISLSNVKQKSNEFLDIAKIAEECRIEGMANAGTLVLDELFETIVPEITKMINFVPQSQDKARVNQLQSYELDYQDNFDDELVEMVKSGSTK